jgi:hypothetical protein
VEEPVVKVSNPQPPPPPPAPSSKVNNRIRAKVLYEFAGTGKNEMPLKIGATIEVITRGPPGGWSKGLIGAFPTDYVQFIEAEDNLMKPAPAPVADAKKDIFDAFSDLQPAGAPQNSSMNVVNNFQKPVSNQTNSGFGTNPFSLPQKSAVAKPESDPFSLLDLTDPVVNEKEVKPIPTTSVFDSIPRMTTPKVATSSEKNIFATVKFSRVAGSATEISIEKGETVLVLNQKDKDWWYGSVVGKSTNPGYFPSNYVELKVDYLPPKPTSQQPSPFAQREEIQSKAKVESSSTQLPSLQPKKYSMTSSVNTISAQPVIVDIPSCCSKVNLQGNKYIVFSPQDEKQQVPVWKLPSFIDIFADHYRGLIDKFESYDALFVISRIRATLDNFLEASKYIDMSSETGSEDIRRIFDKVVYAIRDASDICRMLPNHAEDLVRLYTFLVTYTVRVKSLRTGDFLLIPLGWTSVEDVENAVFLLLMKEQDSNFGGYSVTIINASEGKDTGIQYHLPSVNMVNGLPLRKLSYTFRNVPDERIQNTAFW